MSDPASALYKRLLLIGGPPRSGTTFLAQSLNSHPRILSLIDDHVFECWGLYQYRHRTGLVADFRSRRPTPREAQASLTRHLLQGETLIGAASSPKTEGWPLMEDPLSTEGPTIRSRLDQGLVRHLGPLNQLPPDTWICLKSPEISFVLPDLALSFPSARFILVYRPLEEIAESMFRLGNRVKVFPVYHARWRTEQDSRGTCLPPPGVPAAWFESWQGATDFQRCVLYAAAYITAIVDGLRSLETDRYFLYDHRRMRCEPEAVFAELARFTGVERSGFASALERLRGDQPSLPPDLVDGYRQMSGKLHLDRLMQDLCHMTTGDAG